MTQQFIKPKKKVVTKASKTGRIRLLSTNLKSESLKRLAEGLSTKLGYKVLRSSKERAQRTHLRYGDQKDKIEQYQWFQNHGVCALEFTMDSVVAKEWTQNIAVVCRTLTRASEGRGIVIAECPEQVVNAPVYTKYKKKKKEFRVHVFKDKVVHVLEKRRRLSLDGTYSTKETKVRNTANGYVFCSDDVVEPDGLRALALQASRVTTSDFKGVDIGYNEKKNELFVIEVNSAPGIEGTNVQRYVDIITQ